MLKDGLLRLVYSKDIMELQLKQRDYEVLIRKKEASPQPPVTAPYVIMQSHSPQAMVPSQLPQAQAAPASAGLVSSPTVSAAPPTTEKPKSSHPPLKCPMAGTLYRCPAPGAPPFMKELLEQLSKGDLQKTEYQCMNEPHPVSHKDTMGECKVHQ